MNLELVAASAQVPANFNAGQQVMGNPLAPLTNALNAGQVGSFNPFVGHNTNNPDLMVSSELISFQEISEVAQYQSWY